MSAHVAPAQDASGQDPPAQAGGANPGALWDGDPGSLPRGTRRTLVRLLQGPYLTAELHPELWNSLLADEAAIRRRLGDLFLELVLDREAGLAFTRNAHDPTGESPSVMRTLPLTLVDTVLLLHLRTLLLRTTTPGERVFVDRGEIDDHLAVYRPHVSTDHSGFMRRVSSSIDKLKRASLLRETDVPERYEISPVLALVFSADEVAAVAAEYRRLLGEDDGGDGRADDGGEGGTSDGAGPSGGGPRANGGGTSDAGRRAAGPGDRAASPQEAGGPGDEGAPGERSES
ncbi:DUF4194 domain-containing protein [Actinomyces israelii]|uniref:DUF4194 domain-containing protein n=1 Tax=Actinomyces israelii TaxID=1659 RepID=A0ABT4I9E2_9ACTO|nr:DUF4194 domain-containing protein [Actinomyces israelii]MCZ0858351.1 DUF4194 domain-containing protein [Actinomyces israelii]